MKNTGKLFGIMAMAALVFTLSAPLYGQTAARLETLLETREISWQQAAAFILEAANYEIPGMEFIPEDAAFSFVAGENWLPKNAEPGGAAQLSGVAFLLMKSFGLKGGIFYTIANSPHHAYRELVYKNVIRGYNDPGMYVSGQQLLLMINRIFVIKEQS